MSLQAPVPEPPPGAPSPRGRRASAAPPPSRALPCDAMVAECGAWAWIAWMLLESARLWALADPAERHGLFRPESARRLRDAARDANAPADAAGPLLELVAMCERPQTLSPREVAAACEALARWAAAGGRGETAVHFAEAAAHAEPHAATRAYLAGRACRETGLHERARAWFRRAERLARLAGSEEEFAVAHLGWGTLEHNLGRLPDAERHFLKAARAAFRAGKRGLSASAYHDLLALKTSAGELDVAIGHAERAVSRYPRGHPRLPNFAFDVGRLWMEAGFFSLASHLFDVTLSCFHDPNERIMALAAAARCRAALRDGMRFDELAGAVFGLVGGESRRAASSYLHLAQGARALERWEQAEAFAAEAARRAITEQNASVAPLAADVREEIRLRFGGDVDQLPEQDGIATLITSCLLRKLRGVPAIKQAGLGFGGIAAPAYLHAHRVGHVS